MTQQEEQYQKTDDNKIMVEQKEEYRTGDYSLNSYKCTPTIEQKEDWEKEFDRKYDFSENDTLEYDNLLTIADFIKKTLSQQKQQIELGYTNAMVSFKEECRKQWKDELKKEVEKIGKKYKEHYGVIEPECVGDILSLIEKI